VPRVPLRGHDDAVKRAAMTLMRERAYRQMLRVDRCDARAAQRVQRAYSVRRRALFNIRRDARGSVRGADVRRYRRA